MSTTEASRFKYEVDDRGCWIWQGHIHATGYGQVYDPEARRMVWAHRHSYATHKGEIPPRYDIDHMCQVTRCVNPDHLQAITRLEHARITARRAGKEGRLLMAAQMRRGGFNYREIAEAMEYSADSAARNAVRRAIELGLVDPNDVPPAPRLTEDEREEIRTLYLLGVPQPVIGRFYDIDSSHVSRVCNGKNGHE